MFQNVDMICHDIMVVGTWLAHGTVWPHRCSHWHKSIQELRCLSDTSSHMVTKCYHVPQRSVPRHVPHQAADLCRCCLQVAYADRLSCGNGSKSDLQTFACGDWIWITASVVTDLRLPVQGPPEPSAINVTKLNGEKLRRRVAAGRCSSLGRWPSHWSTNLRMASTKKSTLFEDLTVFRVFRAENFFFSISQQRVELVLYMQTSNKKEGGLHRLVVGQMSGPVNASARISQSPEPVIVPLLELGCIHFMRSFTMNPITETM